MMGEQLKRLPLTVLVAVSTSFAQNTQATQPDVKPRVFLQAASKGNNLAAARDQAMEMSKDLEQDCRGVRVSIYQQNADYTVLLNHIEVGLFVRDNQFQLADRNGDLLARTKEGGSIRSGMKKVCAQILEDWAKPQQPPQQAEPRAAAAAPSRESAATPEPPPVSVPPPAASPMQPAVSSAPASGSPCLQTPQSFSNATIGAFFDGNPDVRRDGIMVAAVTPGGPAVRAGMSVGDVIVAVNDHYLFTIRELTEEISHYEPGMMIRIRYRRYTAINEATVVVGRAQ